jgi:cation:H+ antiporter
LIGLNTVTGLLLLVLLAVALVVVIGVAVRGRRDGDAELEAEVAEYEEADGPPSSLGREVGRSAIGLGGTLLGAQLVVSSALSVASGLGLSEGFVGLTIVAIGTSLPELVTAVQAARRGEDDLVVGNVLGSNLFNSLAAGGLIGVIAGSVTVEGRMVWSLVLMVGVALFVGVVMVWRRTLRRPEAVVLLVGYAAIVPLLGGE